MNLQRIKLVGLAFVAISSLAMAQDTVNLKRTPKVGNTQKFTLKAELEFQGTPIVVTATVLEKTTKAEDGKYTVESTQSDLKINDQEAPAGDDDKSTSTYTVLGKLLETQSAQSDDGSKRMSVLQAFEVPDKDLKVGDTWTIENKADPKLGNATSKIEYKVEAKEKVGKWETFKISFTAKETSGDSPAGATGTVWVGLEDKEIVKYEASWTNAPFPMVGPQNAKVTLTRVE
jgi:hypothetical protein